MNSVSCEVGGVKSTHHANKSKALQEPKTIVSAEHCHLIVYRVNVIDDSQVTLRQYEREGYLALE